MKRVMPDGRFFEMDASHGIFHAFFEIPRLDIVPQAYINGRPIFRGIYEDNDPAKRLQVIVNTTPTSRSTGSGRAQVSARSTTPTRLTS